MGVDVAEGPGGERRYGEFVVVRRHAYVAELALDRPKAMNAVSTDMARSLAAACDALAAEGAELVQ
jgi:enoyl-CoA hydratase/carnithine racemase